MSLTSNLIFEEMSNEFKTSSVSALTALTSPLNIYIGQRDPEFAIGVYVEPLTVYHWYVFVPDPPVTVAERGEAKVPPIQIVCVRLG